MQGRRESIFEDEDVCMIPVASEASKYSFIALVCGEDRD